nr:MAG TPA: hypothetical protein [Caudoviricetes sp.]DAN56817.1 MAG TPA: hypothetical protein [Caudoviricetes sp.]
MQNHNEISRSAALGAGVLYKRETGTRRAGTRRPPQERHAPRPPAAALRIRRTATAGGVPRGAARATPGGYLLTPRIKFFQKTLDFRPKSCYNLENARRGSK